MCELLGLRGDAYQDLYHFTVGGPVDDPRLTTLPPPMTIAARFAFRRTIALIIRSQCVGFSSITARICSQSSASITGGAGAVSRQ